MTKTCTKCGIAKLLEEFSLNRRNKKDGRRSRCKVCMAAYYVANKEAISKKHAAYCVANPEKVKARKAAWAKANPEKVKARQAAWRAANPEKYKAIKAAWDKANPEKIKARKAAYHVANQEKIKARQAAWRAANPEKVKAKNVAWSKANRGKCNSVQARRRATKKQATPAWLTVEQLKQIEAIYKACPKGFHVDHIVPLTSDIVCGLHVPWNLQILPASENLRKGNRLVKT